MLNIYFIHTTFYSTECKDGQKQSFNVNNYTGLTMTSNPSGTAHQPGQSVTLKAGDELEISLTGAPNGFTLMLLDVNLQSNQMVTITYYDDSNPIKVTDLPVSESTFIIL